MKNGSRALSAGQWPGSRVAAGAADLNFMNPTRGRRTARLNVGAAALGSNGVRIAPHGDRLKLQRAGRCPVSREPVIGRQQQTHDYAPVGVSELLAGGGLANSMCASRGCLPRDDGAGGAPFLPRWSAPFFSPPVSKHDRENFNFLRSTAAKHSAQDRAESFESVCVISPFHAPEHEARYEQRVAEALQGVASGYR